MAEVVYKRLIITLIFKIDHLEEGNYRKGLRRTAAVLFDYYMTEPQTTHEEDEIPNFDGSGIKGRRRKKL